MPNHLYIYRTTALLWMNVGYKTYRKFHCKAIQLYKRRFEISILLCSLRRSDCNTSIGFLVLFESAIILINNSMTWKSDCCLPCIHLTLGVSEVLQAWVDAET